MSNLRIGTLIALLSGTAFATLAIFAKWAYAAGANVPSVLFLRFTGAAVVFWLYHLIKGGGLRYDRGTAIKLMVMGGLGYGSMSAFYLSSVSRIPASLAVMLLYLHPGLVSLLTVFLGWELFDRRKAAALLATFTGMVLVLGVSFQSTDLLGIFYGLGSAVVYTIYITAGSSILKPLDPLKATMYIMTGGALAYSFYGLLTGNLSFGFAPQAWLAIGGMALIATVLAVGSFWLAVKLIGPSKTAIISTVEPLVTVILACLLFEEALTALQVCGGLLIVLGVYILQYPAGQKRETSQGASPEL